MKLTTITHVSVDGVMQGLGVGQGTRLFPATGPDTALGLVDSRATPGGETIRVYRPTGPPKYATATP
jgi:hypothetical protein